MADTALYRTIWRWHFYAGLFVLPFVLVLSITGAIYLFKPQTDRWEERAFLGLGRENAVSADRQLEAALAAYPGSRFNHYRLPREAGDAAMLQLALPDGGLAEVYVSPQGKVLGSLDPETRISPLIGKFHGSLMLGTWGDRLVELAASWTIVLLLTGLYLWWPRPFSAAGTLWPRLSLRGRSLLKDIHRVTGFWIAGLVLVMLASGLPWAGTWGTAFKTVRTELGWVSGPQDWKIGAGDGHHDHGAHDSPIIPGAEIAPPPDGPPLSYYVDMAELERIAFPALVLPPGAPQRFAPPLGNEWKVTSEAQNRTLIQSITYDPETGAERTRSGFADKHPIDRVVNYGIALHEGQLFGLANQLMGLATALVLIAVSILGTLMWLRRKPAGELGAPPPMPPARRPLLAIGIVALALLLPLFGLSLLAVIAVDLLLGKARARTKPRSGAAEMV